MSEGQAVMSVLMFLNLGCCYLLCLRVERLEDADRSRR